MGLQWEAGGEATGYSALACPSSHLQEKVLATQQELWTLS